MLRALGFLLALAPLLAPAGCADLPRLVWPGHVDPDAPAILVTFVQREDDLCRYADDIRLSLLGPRVFGEIADPAGYDHHTDAIYAFCLTRPDPSAQGLAWLTAEVRTLHEIGTRSGAVLPPPP